MSSHGVDSVSAVLFDFDGTLVDSAPDMADAANEMLAARDRAPAPYDALRRMVGSGARGMLGVAFAVKPGDAGFDGLREEFLQRYETRMLARTQVFDEMHAVLQGLTERRIRWGIVTNKATRLAQPILHGLGLSSQCAALVGGDTTPFTKPRPEPLLEAARQMDVPSARCVYVGDDVRDVDAGRAAGMRTGAAAWGYLGDGQPIEQWGADRVLATPASLLNWLDLA